MFLSWCPYKLILLRLKEIHGIERGLTWLKEQFKRIGVSRRGNYTPSGIVMNCIKRELRSSNSTVGYRAMWKILRDKYMVIARRDTVMELMRLLDPRGVVLRRSRRLQRRVYTSKGPNFCWHIDGYDKLSAFGFHIHGCIDGFSRKILWLRTATTNHDPKVVLSYFLSTVQSIGGCPTCIRADRGTENGLVAAVQMALRSYGSDTLAGEKSFIYGSSPTNVRIEAWWSQLRRHKTGWWIETFKMMEQNGDFDRSNITHLKCMAVVFQPILERELAEFVQHWNSHQIRHSSRVECPGGIPNDLYDIPSTVGAENCLKPNIYGLWETAMTEYARPPPPICDDTFYLRCHALVLDQFSLDLGSEVTLGNCMSVYQYLVDNV